MRYLIVGGSSGMGLETVRRLARAGHEVDVWSRHASDELRDTGATHHEVDVREDVSQAALPDELDGIGYFPGSINLAPFERLKLDAFREDLEINLLGAVRVLQRGLPVLARSGGGSVVVVSTVAAATGMPYHASVAAAKAGLEGLARALAAEYAARNVRVNAIAPSITDTPLAGRLLGNDEKRERSAERHPLKRVGEPSDMAAAAVYLLSPDSRWVTGQVIHVDGGLSTLR